MAENKNFTNWTDEEFSKLPKWAQTKVSRDNALIKEQENVIAAMNGSPTSRIRVSLGGSQLSGEQFGIVAPYGVDFWLPGEDGEQRCLNVRVASKESQYNKEGMLQIMATGHPNQIVTMPQVTNVIHVGLRD